MRQVYEDYLFSKGYLVSDPADVDNAQDTHPIHALVALAHYAEIYVTQHPERANLHMLEVATRNLGKDVAEPFMRGFPETARELSPDLRLFDKMVHYFQTYGLGDFSTPGHSLFDQHYKRVAFAEDVTPKEFAILTCDEAEVLLDRAVDGFLDSTRPLNDASYQLLLHYLTDHNKPPSACGCKDTVCRLIIDTRSARFSHLLTMPDIIRLLEWMLELKYPSMTTNKLNLKNKDRVLIRNLLDNLFEQGHVDTCTCLEKKKTWNGLLHHIHYQPRCPEATEFCMAMRSRDARSAYSEVERLIQRRDIRTAAQTLAAKKGPAAVARKLAHLISRRAIPEDVDFVLELLESCNKIVLIQLLHHFYLEDGKVPRVFTFTQLNKLKKHIETPKEMFRRRTVFNDETQLQLLTHIEDLLERSCHATLGKVYADKDLKRIAVPLQESTSMGGYGTLPCGSQLPIPKGKKVRAFVYWEKVNDIDLSCFSVDDEGLTNEYSWRIDTAFLDGLLFSGDQTSGYHGGSEYFDVDLDMVAESHPNVRYLVFCANVYTEEFFSNCICRAGYMLRDAEDSGEVFEPKTVQSSFTITCASSEAYLFALDIRRRLFIWLNIGAYGSRHIAGEGDISFLLKYVYSADVINLYRFAQMLATEVVDTPDEADVIFSDEKIDVRENQEQIRSTDTARIIELLNA